MRSEKVGSIPKTMMIHLCRRPGMASMTVTRPANMYDNHYKSGINEKKACDESTFHIIFLLITGFISSSHHPTVSNSYSVIF